MNLEHLYVRPVLRATVMPNRTTRQKTALHFVNEYEKFS